MTISWMDPHTTNARSRGCMECHADSRVLGLGSGSLQRKDGRWHFIPATSSRKIGDNTMPRLDGFVNMEGKRLVNVSRPDLRPFDRAELEAILDAGRCIFCHSSFKDKVMKNWNPLSPPSPCTKAASKGQLSEKR